MKKKNYIIFTLLLLCCLIVPVKAEDNINSDLFDTEKQYAINESYTNAGDEILFDKNIFGSGMIAGNKITTKGYVDGGLFVAGNEISIEGFSEFVITAGNTISVSGNIEKETIVAGRELTLEKNATFGRDSYLYGQTVSLSGSFSRNVTIYAEEVTVDNTMITGNLKIICSKLIIGDNVHVDGTLTYNKLANNEISDKASFGKLDEIEIKENKKVINFSNVLSSLAGYVSLLVVFAVVALYCSKVFKKIESTSFDAMQILTMTGLGLLAVILTPLIVLILFTLYVGAPLALIILALYLVCLYLSNMFMGYYVGRYVWTNYAKKEHNILLEGLVGISLLYVLSLIPYVGVISVLISFLCGFGLIVESLKK